MTNSELLKEKIKSSGLKRSFIAEKLNISSYSLSRKVEGVCEFKPSEIKAICKVLGITSNEDVMQIFLS